MARFPLLPVMFCCIVTGEIRVAHAETESQTAAAPFLAPTAERLDVHAKRHAILATHDAAATKTDTPIEQIPQNLTVITQARMTVLNARSVSEALRYTAGVSDYGSKDDPRGYFGTIRGFTPDIYLDGTRTPDASTSQSFSIEPWGLEEMDVLRGASSALYGSGQIGGIVNAVSKRPHDRQTNDIAIQTGSYNRAQGAIDVGGALSADHALLWRFNGLIRKSDTYARNILSNEIYVAPSLRWRPDAATDITLLTSFEQLDAGSTSQFLPANGTVLPNRNGSIPRNFLSSDESYDVYSKRQVAIGYAFERRLAPNWRITQNMRYAHLDLLYRFVTTSALSADQKSITRQALLQSGNYNNVTLDTRSDVTFGTGPIRHEVLTGIDYRHDFIALRRGQRAAPALSLFNPLYRAVTYPTYATTINTNAGEDQTGFYAQDQADWQGLHLTLSGREDLTDSSTRNNRTSRSTPQNNNAFTGRVGLSYSAPFGLTPYFAYSTAFQPQVGVTRLSTPFLPLRGRQFEAGVKFAPPGTFFGHNFLLTADVFDLLERNVLTPDPADSTYSIQTGAQKTRGVEIEGLGRLPGKFDVILSFTVQDPRITRSTVAAQIGQRPVTVPSHMASGFVRRKVDFGRSWSASFGTGVRYTGNTAGALPATFLVPSQLVWDMVAGVDHGRTHLRINGSNVFNRQYVSICTRSVACAWAPGRNVFATLSYSF